MAAAPPPPNLPVTDVPPPPNASAPHGEGNPTPHINPQGTRLRPTASSQQPVLGKAPGGGVDVPDPFVPPTETARPVPVPRGSVPPEINTPPEATFRQPPLEGRRRPVVLIVGGLVVLLLIGGAGVMAARFLLGDDTPADAQPEASVTPATDLPLFNTPSTSPTAGEAVGGDNSDQDQDGLSNAEERFYNTDPNNADTDADGFKDAEELRAGYDPRQRDAKLDSDNDGFPDPDERQFGSDPFNPDSDGDGFKDGDEIKNGYNPLKPSPGDKL